MATTRTFQDMLNEYLANDLLKEELLKRDYVLNKITKDNTWKGGKIPVPFRGNRASSVRFGKLTASNDISQSKYVRGNITDYIEVWGSMLFNHRDLQEHNGKIPETTFLRILPDEIDDFMDFTKMCTSVQLGTGPHFAVVTDDTNRATGVMKVNRIDRFELQQHIVIDDDNSGLLNVYVIAIDVNASTVTLSATRGGAFVDLSAYTVAQNARFYYDGVTDGAGNFTTFTSMKSAFLSAANGGSTSLHGVSKLLYPHLQAINVDAANTGTAGVGYVMDKNNFLDFLFDSYTICRNKARGGNANTFLMSLRHLGTAMKLIETQKGAFLVTKDQNASIYGWTEIEITSVKGKLILVGIQEWDDDVIAIVDWNTMKFMTNGFFKKRISPDGIEYFEVRSEDGFQYIVDISLFGEMMYTKPGNNGIIYGITYLPAA